MSEQVQAHITVGGRVQGVFFRAFAQQVAKDLGISGYACNLRNGSVEVVAEGEKSVLELLISQLKAGPPEALVNRCDVVWSGFTGHFNGFDIRF